jgi:hypothetical protein
MGSPGIFRNSLFARVHRFGARSCWWAENHPTRDKWRLRFKFTVLDRLILNVVQFFLLMNKLYLKYDFGFLEPSVSSECEGDAMLAHVVQGGDTAGKRGKGMMNLVHCKHFLTAGTALIHCWFQVCPGRSSRNCHWVGWLGGREEIFQSQVTSSHVMRMALAP